jgi:dCTP diphosphatase
MLRPATYYNTSPTFPKSHRSRAMTDRSDLLMLRDKLRAFAEARNWDQFHSPKNLSMALMVEVAELMEHFQWLTEEQSGSLDAAKKAVVADELADILLYLVRLSDKLGVDLSEAALQKLEKNAAKYPADRVRGSSKKYSEY